MNFPPESLSLSLSLSLLLTAALSTSSLLRPLLLLFFCMLRECCLDLAKPLIRGLYCGTADSSVFLISLWMKKDRWTGELTGKTPKEG